MTCLVTETICMLSACINTVVVFYSVTACRGYCALFKYVSVVTLGLLVTAIQAKASSM